jgi:hypothetical protein
LLDIADAPSLWADERALDWRTVIDKVPAIRQKLNESGGNSADYIVADNFTPLLETPPKSNKHIVGAIFEG